MAKAEVPVTTHDANDILETASRVLKTRGQEYNKIDDVPGRERHMSSIVTSFNVMTGHNLSIREGWLFMVLLKIARASSGAGEDTYVDMAAYAALAGEQRNG